MSINTSATGGYLAPFGAPPLDDDALDRFIQSLVVGITGININMVRPRWQALPPEEPSQDTNWAALGITTFQGDTTPAIVHHAESIIVNPGPNQITLDGYDELRRYENMTVLVSFYGPNARSNARLLRDGLKVDQNREALFLAGMAIGEIEPIVPLPELTNNANRWRVDLPFHVQRTIIRLYPVENLLSAEGAILSDAGSTPWDTTKKR